METNTNNKEPLVGLIPFLFSGSIEKDNKSLPKPAAKRRPLHQVVKEAKEKSSGGSCNVLSRYTAFAKGMHNICAKTVLTERISSLSSNDQGKHNLNPAASKQRGWKERVFTDADRFNILVVEKENSAFAWELGNIIEDCKSAKGQIRLIRLTAAHNLNFANLKNINLVFIEDQFLVDTTPLANSSLCHTESIVLLLNMHLVNHKSAEIKEAILENSLNLSGHIFLADYSQDLIKKWITDLIKTKALNERKSV